MFSTVICIYSCFILNKCIFFKCLHKSIWIKCVIFNWVNQSWIGWHALNLKPEALKSLYRSPGNKKNQLVLCKNYVLRHLGITINIKNTKFVKDLPMIDAQFRFNQCNSFREEYISVFSPYGSVLILWPVVAAILDFRSA